MRIVIPNSPLARLKIEPDTHPNHYQMPRIHTKSYDYEADLGNAAKANQESNANGILANKAQAEDEKEEQESYECSGINVFIHYIKNFEPLGLLRIRCTLYEGPKLARDQESKACQWSSKIVSPEESLVANQENMDKLMKMGVYIYSETKYGKKDIVVPINDDHSWLRDFYTLLMENHLKNELYLMVELMVKENPYKGGTYRNMSVADPESVIQEYSVKAATMVKCNNFDGTIRYGSYELPFFEPPLNRTNPKENIELPYIIKLTIGQPVSKPENIPNDLYDGKKEQKSLFRKPDGFEDNSNFPKKNPNANNPDPFILNEKNQVNSELFQKDDMIILYVDGARYLPENVSFSRVVIKCYTSAGNEVVSKLKVAANLTKSTGQIPFYGLREEIDIYSNPNLDPTMIGVFKIETFDRANGEQRIVGYSFFPFFLDKNIKSIITDPKEKKYVLQNGMYQLPIYSEKPDLKSPIKIEDLTKLEKLPCSTLLIRVDKAPRDGDDKPYRYKDLDETKRYELGVVTVPPKYSQGLYNTIY